jgi:ring-1,2-phenylacetyl-CoA epoxidase subunit PaaD
MIITKKEILKLLEKVYDPEIPVLNIVEMGIVRNIKENNNVYEIEITPTYSGCPAMKTIEDEILDVLHSEGIEEAKVKKVYSPPWTTDWLSEETKLKLSDCGIAPPEGKSDQEFILKKITCPFCKSNNTKLTSEFGSTSCKALHYCDNCHQPFEHFKCI